jgi:ankyrin repeat protein
MTTRMTAQRLGRLIAAGDEDGVRAAVSGAPGLLARTVERDGQAGWTPLHLAVAENQPGAVRVLVDAGADLSARTEHFRTPLNLALECAPDLVPQLRAAGAPVDPASAAYLDEVDELTRHLDDGARPSDPTTGMDLLSWAARGGAARTARLLLDRGADADAGALHAAAGAGSLRLVRLLLAAGADVDRCDPATGRAPLHEAVAAGPAGEVQEVVRALLGAGADVNATTSDGATALDISRVAAARSRRADAGRATGNDALADLLVAHGATG